MPASMLISCWDKGKEVSGTSFVVVDNLCMIIEILENFNLIENGTMYGNILNLRFLTSKKIHICIHDKSMIDWANRFFYPPKTFIFAYMIHVCEAVKRVLGIEEKKFGMKSRLRIPWYIVAREIGIHMGIIRVTTKLVLNSK